MEQTKICVDCGNEFTISPAAAKHILSQVDEHGNNLVLPKRCFACRQKRRASNNTGSSTRQYSEPREMRKFPHNKKSFNSKRGNRWDQE